MPFPIDPEALTTEWLTRTLRDAGAIQSAKVTAFQTRELSQAKGMAARYILISLSYDTPKSDAPRSLFAKFPRPNWAEKGDQMGTFDRESHFYRHLADRVVLRVPRCYYNALDETGFLLLLEDLSPARCGDRVAGCSFEQAELAVAQVAGMHAAWWMHPDLSNPDLVVQPDLDVFQTYAGMYSESARAFMEKAGHLIPTGVSEVVERIGDYFMPIVLYTFQEPPLTFIHADYHLDNLFFATPEGGTPFAVIDWHQGQQGQGPYDIGYFLCRSFPPGDRKAWERKLLETYYARLIEGGVEDYPFNRCWHDYQFSQLLNLMRIVMIIGDDMMGPDQKNLFYDILMPRSCAAALELNAVDLVDKLTRQ